MGGKGFKTELDVKLGVDVGIEVDESGAIRSFEAIDGELNEF
jgi:hypothetical protein